MLFTSTPPDRQGEQLRLHFSPEDAKVGRRGPIFGVLVHYDGHLGRLTTLANLYRGIDPGWTERASHHSDGCLLVRGPIPAALFTEIATVFAGVE